MSGTDKLFNRLFNQLNLLTNVETLAGTKTLAASAPTLQHLDPGGAGRTVLLPAEASSKGLVFLIFNDADAAETLTVKEDSDTTTIALVTQGELALFVCNGAEWTGGSLGGTGMISTDDIAADAITGAKIADDQVDSEHYVAASIDNEHLAANSVDSDNYVDGSIDAEHLAAQILTGAAAANVADVNAAGGLPVLHRINQAAGANGDTDITLTHKTRVIDFWVVLTGTGVASSVCTLKNGSDAISNGLDTSGADKAVVRAGTIDDAFHEVAAAGTLRITGSAGATQPALTAYILGVRVA